ncbi:MAG TPA: prenyltransferase/squalene oxidase repeat-containing protein [Candidatus Limnocylindria bacterium]|nr:prenyltransferase/squalene oxidase repeat-containing protein [Candidatus Limnocylindria bacterium]
MLDQIITELLQNQNPDGGWGAVRGKRSNTETTSLAVMALQALAGGTSADNRRRGIEWLVRRQNPDHSWPLNQTVTAGSWTTALAITALGASVEHSERVHAAARWVLEQKGSKPGILAEIILWATGQSGVNKLSKDLIGWSWVPSSFSWVEPTSYALIALKKQRLHLTGTNVDERIREADAMIYDRMCTGGGWNYGNSKVLDYALWPYPDITALALIAMQDHASEKANQDSLQVLSKTARETDSGLALCWAATCFNLYGRDPSDFHKQIEKRFATSEFLGETKTLALAVIALGGKSNPFRF